MGPLLLRCACRTSTYHAEAEDVALLVVALRPEDLGRCPGRRACQAAIDQCGVAHPAQPKIAHLRQIESSLGCIGHDARVRLDSGLDLLRQHDWLAAPYPYPAVKLVHGRSSRTLMV